MTTSAPFLSLMQRIFILYLYSVRIRVFLFLILFLPIVYRAVVSNLAQAMDMLPSLLRPLNPFFFHALFDYIFVWSILDKVSLLKPSSSHLLYTLLSAPDSTSLYGHFFVFVERNQSHLIVVLVSNKVDAAVILLQVHHLFHKYPQCIRLFHRFPLSRDFLPLPQWFCPSPNLFPNNYNTYTCSQTVLSPSPH